MALLCYKMQKIRKLEDKMIPEKMNHAINDQIGKELYSEYLYLAIAVWFAEKNLDGFAHWFFKQAEEEHAHALKFIHFLIERSGSVKIPAIAEPKLKAKKYKEFFITALNHEKSISAAIAKLADLAIEINDHASKSILQSFIDEQVEEEASVEKIIAYLEMIGENTGAIFMLNAELGKR